MHICSNVIQKRKSVGKEGKINKLFQIEAQPVTRQISSALNSALILSSRSTSLDLMLKTKMLPVFQYEFFITITILLALIRTDGAGYQLIIVNNCNESIWPGIQAGAGQQTLKDGGFLLSSGGEVAVDVPDKWSGRLWGRQLCNFDSNGKGSCATGDCSGQLHCQGLGGVPPATVVEMTLGSLSSPLHFYDVSLVDGFNLPVSMKPVGGGIGCGVASCAVDLNVCCPSALEVRVGGKVVGCKSACLAMQSPKYCCTGQYADPKSCKPTVFANLFKAICPKAYSYAFDDSSSLNKCRAKRYVITFCPPQ